VTVQGLGRDRARDGEGLPVAYSYSDEQGDPHSGLFVLLNDDTGMLLVANVQVDPPDLNLLEAEGLVSPYAEAQQAVTEGLIVLPEEARAH